MSLDGNRVAIGAPYADEPPFSNTGEAKVYEYYKDTNDNVKWIQIGSTLVGTKTNQAFGYVVAISGNGQSLTVGSPESLDVNGAGRVNMYTIPV